jgi:hypothetical protein
MARGLTTEIAGKPFQAGLGMCTITSAFTESVNPKPLPMIVAGAGGYNLRLHGLSKAFPTAKRPVKRAGGDGVFESFNDSQHGYLRITVTKKSAEGI